MYTQTNMYSIFTRTGCFNNITDGAIYRTWSFPVNHPWNDPEKMLINVNIFRTAKKHNRIHHVQRSSEALPQTQHLLHIHRLAKKCFILYSRKSILAAKEGRSITSSCSNMQHDQNNITWEYHVHIIAPPTTSISPAELLGGQSPIPAYLLVPKFAVKVSKSSANNDSTTDSYCKHQQHLACIKTTVNVRL